MRDHPEENIKQKSNVIETNLLPNSCNRNNVFLMALKVKVYAEDEVIPVRALLDSGCQYSYISKPAIKKLGIKTNNMIKIQNMLFGGRETQNQIPGVYELLIRSMDETFNLLVYDFSEDIICGTVPNVSSSIVINELNKKSIILSDLGNEGCEIGLLLGADFAGMLFMEGSIEIYSGSKFDWEQIPDIIDRFRSYPIGISADIEKAFLQLGIAPEHRNLLRFFYPTDNEQIVYRHCRVVFGVSYGPFLLAAELSHFIEHVPAEDFEIADKLQLSFYDDNCVEGVIDVRQQKEFILKAREILSCGCFNLRNWESNVECKYISTSTETKKLLGILWDLDRDVLKCNVCVDDLKTYGNITKRFILAAVHRIFNPLGILCSATLLPKMLLQNTWKLKLSFDPPLSDDFVKPFLKWWGEVDKLAGIEIPLCFEINDTTQMHVFVDACKDAYTIYVFLRSNTSQVVKDVFVREKSRVDPLIITRLELMTCCIGARLAHSVQRKLNITEIETIFWSDSVIALYWLRGKGGCSVFVSNRIKEIKTVVPNKSNPAGRYRLLSDRCKEFSSSFSHRFILFIGLCSPEIEFSPQKWLGYPTVLTEYKDAPWQLEVGTGLWQIIPTLVKRYLEQCVSLPLEKQPTIVSLWDQKYGSDAITAQYNVHGITFKKEYSFSKNDIIRVSYLNDVTYGPTRYYRGEYLLKTGEKLSMLRSGLATFSTKLDICEKFQKAVVTLKYDGSLFNILYIPKQYKHFELLKEQFPYVYYPKYGLLFIGSKQTLIMEKSLRQRFHTDIEMDFEAFIRQYAHYLKDKLITLHFKIMVKQAQKELTVYYPKNVCKFIGCTTFTDTTRQFALPTPTYLRAVQQNHPWWIVKDI
ncbi:hypothetical protein AVEN_64851-1 [Araneus ventricosus]|uniref:Peptidase aspartic putative domain-containing protein n=1 Tax=Araneus ventricosus TaxID=182803 RepID=A0A4Y2GK08_ARAVE|nr:hypothetical protein AVEN_64851-1 [Araneus ventricosus]